MDSNPVAWNCLHSFWLKKFTRNWPLRLAVTVGVLPSASDRRFDQIGHFQDSLRMGVFAWYFKKRLI